MTRLLVSVRNLDEAITAGRGGAHLIDLKEPARGPLGRCDESVWAAVADRYQGKRPLSAALGEWHEWTGVADSQVSRILGHLKGFDFAKIGPGDASRDGGAGLEKTYRRLKSLGPPGLRWIAVVYADSDRSGALPRRRVFELARSCAFDGILIDTFDKSRPHFWGPGWARFVRATIEAEMIVALAGGLTVKSMRRLTPLGPHWLAVRGAACHQGERNGRVSYRRVRALANELDGIDMRQ